jgi:hypothetical protein
MEESARDRKRNSARKKSEFSVYSQKAVRSTEIRWAKEQQRAVGQNICAAQAKNATKQKNHLKTKNGS